MIGFAVLYVCLTVLVLAERYVAPLVREWMALRYAKPTPVEPIKIPLDLLAWANQFNAQWAVDDARNFLMEEYERTKDWNAVRSAAQQRS